MALTVPILLTLALAAPFDAQSLDGKSIAGELSALSAEEVTLQTDSGPVAVPVKSLAALVRRGASAGAGEAKLWVELRDGSGLAATEYTTADGKATILNAGATKHELPLDRVRWVRFGAADQVPAPLVKQWNEITEKDAPGDLLVVKKDDALDYLEGVIRGVDAEVCRFELDGEEIPVKRPKIAGLVYAQHEKTEIDEPLGLLKTTDGTKLQLKSFELAGEKLRVETTAGTTHEIPLETVARFDFSSGKIAFLSDLEPESASYTPLVGFEKPPEGLLDFYQYRRDVGFEQNPLRLDGHVFNKGLSLATRTELVYKLPDKYRWFRATAGIDDATRETGSVHLEIKGDGKSLWQGEVRGTDPAQALELDVSGVKRLEIVADFGDGLDIGDRLDLGDAQVTK